MADSIRILREKTLDELEREYDQAAPMVSPGLSFYRQEIEWRYQKMGADKIEKLTEDMRSMTAHMKVITIAILVSDSCQYFFRCLGLTEVIQPRRHGRTCSGHPRLPFSAASKTWMPVTRTGMTIEFMLRIVVP